MHITPREEERILLSAAADLARRRLARGARLGTTEAVALLCDEICEMAWDDVPLEDIIKRARGLISPDEVLPGVAAAVPRLQVEALFPHGTTLVHLDAPFGRSAEDGPGAVRPARRDVALAEGHARGTVVLRNTGPLPIWVSSHVPLSELNPALVTTPTDVAGLRLDLPAGAAVKIDPGEEREVAAVSFVAEEEM